MTWKRIGGAAGSTGAIAPITLQYSGVAGITATSGGGGPNGGFGLTASGAGATRAADSIVAPRLGKPIAPASIVSFSAAQACAGSAGAGGVC